MAFPAVIAGISTLFPHVLDLIDRVIPDEKARDAAKKELLSLEQNGKLKEIEAQMSAILAEARSEDPWTSRARPSFMYVIYVLILASIPMGILAAVDSGIASQISGGFRAWLHAIPESMWWLFGTGYLGYTGAREYGKTQKLKYGPKN